MRVAVCDDVEAYRNLIYNRIKALYGRKGIRVEVDCYESGQMLIEKCEEKQYDIVFSDISMPQMDGFELADRISSILPAVFIVFFTEFQQLVFESFRYHPIWFVRKANLDTDLGDAIAEIERLIANRERLVTITYRDMDKDFKTEKIRMSELLYISCNGHKLTYCTEDHERSASGSLVELEKEYNKYGFVRVHNKYLVNSRHIYSIQKKSVILDGDIELPLSRYRLKEVEDYMIRFGGFQ